MISQTLRVNRILFAPISNPRLQTAFSKLFPIQRTMAFLNLDDGFYSSSCPILFLSIDLEHSVPRDSVSIVLVILHELPFLRIACSRLKRTGTRRSTRSFLSKFLGVFDHRVKAIFCTDCKNVSTS